MVLLPTSTSKLLAQWQGPYPVIRRIGNANYEIDMTDRRKRKRIFHVNMLRKWHIPTVTSCWAEEGPEDDHDEVLLWRGDEEEQTQPTLGEQLTVEQKVKAQDLIGEFKDVFQSEPGRTSHRAFD